MTFIVERPCPDEGHLKSIVRDYRWNLPSFLSTLVAVTALTGCSAPNNPTEHIPEPMPTNSSAGTRLSQTQVVGIAKEAAKNKGVQLLEYEEPEVHFEFVHKNKTWTVFFAGKEARPGNHFSVSVDDQTGDSQVMRGK